MTFLSPRGMVPIEVDEHKNAGSCPRCIGNLRSTLPRQIPPIAGLYLITTQAHQNTYTLWAPYQ
jgi:hypothetical protein